MNEFVQKKQSDFKDKIKKHTTYLSNDDAFIWSWKKVKENSFN